MSYSLYWLIASAVFFLLEAFGIPGIGFLFGGLAAILVACFIELGVIAAADVILQLALFALITSISAALLWKKLKTWRLNPSAPLYSNMVGTEGTVHGNGLAGSEIGEVHWSGTTMRARLADPSAPALPAGSNVIISAVDGTLLLVKAKH